MSVIVVVVVIIIIIVVVVVIVIIIIIIGATGVDSVPKTSHRPCQTATRNYAANLFRAPGRGEPRGPEAALSHLAAHLPKAWVRSGAPAMPSRSAGRSEGPWISAVDEEVQEVPDCHHRKSRKC